MENWTAFSHLHTTEALKYIHIAHCKINAIFMKLIQQLFQSLTNQLHSSITKRPMTTNSSYAMSPDMLHKVRIF